MFSTFVPPIIPSPCRPTSMKPASRIAHLGDAITRAITRVVDRVAPQTQTPFDLLASVSTMLPMVMSALNPPQPIDLDGPKVKQVRRELAAEEAWIQAAFAAERARIVAAFGPRFERAHAADAGDVVATEPKDASRVIH